MKLKMILLMLITLSSVFLSIYVATIYTSFIAPYLIGFFTPIIVNEVYMFDINKIKNTKGDKLWKRLNL